METNLRLTYGDFKLFVGYTYTDANTARHTLNNVLMYEIEDKLKIGLEAYHFSRQRLSGGTFGKPYWITGLMAEKLWEKLRPKKCTPVCKAHKTRIQKPTLQKSVHFSYSSSGHTLLDFDTVFS
jgi:hypothetical protein